MSSLASTFRTLGPYRWLGPCCFLFIYYEPDILGGEPFLEKPLWQRLSLTVPQMLYYQNTERVLCPWRIDQSPFPEVFFLFFEINATFSYFCWMLRPFCSSLEFFGPFLVRLGHFLAKFGFVKTFSAFLKSFFDSLWWFCNFYQFPQDTSPWSNNFRARHIFDVALLFPATTPKPCAGSFSPRTGMMTWHHGFPQQL